MRGLILPAWDWLNVMKLSTLALCAAASLTFALGVLLGERTAAQERRPISPHAIVQFGHPPQTRAGPLSAELGQALDALIANSFDQANWEAQAGAALATISQSEDPRVAWLIRDMMKFTWRRLPNDALAEAASRLLGIEFQTIYRRHEIMDHMIAWDIPSYPGYLAHKRAIFTHYVPGWERILVDGAIDWRLVAWGGVNIDDRPYGATDEPCICIPAIDNPEVSSAAAATWLKDDDIVFGIAVNGEFRAYPRRIMEVREMVNDTLGGRDLGIPYCTLCGAAQAYFTDDLPEGAARPVLRTSGLLIRSNKVMFDVNTYSVFDTFHGRAVTGPLAEIGVQLKQATVVTTDWGTWKAEHPETTVLVEALALGRDYDLRNTRDANGPIFPVGDVDPRLPVHEDVIGVVTPSGQPVAFPRAKTMAALQSGADVTFGTVRLKRDAGGVKIVGADGADLGSHQAFWFAWSQFHPTTALWPDNLGPTDKSD